MKLNRTTVLKVLLVVPALLIATVLLPATALADTPTVDIKFDSAGGGDAGDGYPLPLNFTYYLAPDATTTLKVGALGDQYVVPNEHYEFDYWTADIPFYKLENAMLTRIDAQTPLPYTLEGYYVADSGTITAHFKQAAFTVTYKGESGNYCWIIYSDDSTCTDLHDPTEDVISGYTPFFADSTQSPPREYAVYTADGFVFDHWIADVDVTLYKGDPTAEQTIKAGDPITQAQMLSITVDKDITLTAQCDLAEYTVTFDPGKGTLPNGMEATQKVKYDNSPTFVQDAYPNDSSYEFDCWTASVPVTLTTGKTIAKGDPLTSDEVGKVRVTSAITFTANYKLKPATVTYKSSTGGLVAPGGESVDLDERKILTPGTGEITVGDISGATASPDSTNYEFDYWEADQDVYVFNYDTAMLETVDAGTKLKTTNILSSYYVDRDTTFTAYFKQTTPNTYTVTYTVDENGDEFPTGTDTESVDEGSSPVSVPTPVAKDTTKYTFNYWTADVAVTLNDGTTIAKGNSITSDQIGKVKVTSNITFKAQFQQVKGTATYTTDGNGSVSPASKTLDFDVQTLYGPAGAAITGSTLKPATGYEFDYWTADQDVYTDVTATSIRLISKGFMITSEDLQAGIFITKDTTFEAHFKRAKVTVAYKTDDHGVVGKAGESVGLSSTYPLRDGSGELAVGRATGTTPSPNENYEFAYWTADRVVYDTVNDGGVIYLVPVPLETRLTTYQLSYYYVAGETTFTAHFKRTPPYTVTYTSAGNGTVSPTSEQVEAEGDSPKGPTTITPDAGYEFSHWTADKDVEVANEDATQAISLTSNDNGADAQAATTTITAGQPITPEQFSRILMADDVEFEAHFKQTSVDPDPEPEPVNPDGGDDSGSDTIKPADGADGKVVPKTGDALPGATAAVALGAGVAVAGAALLKKRHQ